MENLSYIILALVVASTIDTTIVNFIKPAYEKLSFGTTISIFLSLALGILFAFALRPYSPIEVDVLLVVLIGLAVGTGANIFYDVWKIIQNWGKNVK